MRLTLYTDYSLRVLLYLALKKGQMVTISEVASFYKVSRSHLMKAVHNLGMRGYIVTRRGKNGGMRLSRPAHEIVIGDVIRKMERDSDLLGCFNATDESCGNTRICSVKSMMINARDNFFDMPDRHTIADALKPPVKIMPENEPNVSYAMTAQSEGELNCYQYGMQSPRPPGWNPWKVGNFFM